MTDMHLCVGKVTGQRAKTYDAALESLPEGVGKNETLYYLLAEGGDEERFLVYQEYDISNKDTMHKWCVIDRALRIAFSITDIRGIDVAIIWAKNRGEELYGQ